MRLVGKTVLFGRCVCLDCGDPSLAPSYFRMLKKSFKQRERRSWRKDQTRSSEGEIE